MLKKAADSSLALAPQRPIPWHPHPYQQRAVRWLVTHGGAGLFLDPGLGKTSITLKAIDALHRSRVLQRALVVAPLRPCYMVWPAEQRKWADFASLQVDVLHGDKKDAAADAALQGGAQVCCVNPEGLEWLTSDWFSRFEFDTLVVDESTKFKHTNTKRFKLLKPLLDSFARRWILTGTPTPNGYEDLFGQLYVVDQGKALGQYITHYRMNYFFQTGYGGYTWRLKTAAEGMDAEREIQKKIKPYILRLDAADYLKLPARIDNVIRVDLPPSARKVYDQLEDDFFAVLESGQSVTAASAGAAMQKCSQVANGGLYYYDDPDVEHFLQTKIKQHTALLHTAKSDALLDLIEELQHTPLIVGYEFKHDLARLLAILGGNTPYLGGGVSPRKSQEIEQRWNRGETPVLLAHPAAMGHGLNLQGSGNHVCWFGIPWDYELYDQMVRRVLRQGQRASHVYVHHIVARDTVDEAKMRSLHGKARGQNALLAALRTYRAGRGAKQSL